MSVVSWLVLATPKSAPNAVATATPTHTESITRRSLTRTRGADLTCPQAHRHPRDGERCGGGAHCGDTRGARFRKPRSEPKMERAAMARKTTSIPISLNSKLRAGGPFSVVKNALNTPGMVTSSFDTQAYPTHATNAMTRMDASTITPTSTTFAKLDTGSPLKQGFG